MNSPHICPICDDPIFDDAEIVEFADFRGTIFHAVCVESVGADRAYEIAKWKGISK